MPTRSRIVPDLLRAAQAEGLIRVADVQAWLLDAGLPASRGTAHATITGESIDAVAASVCVERMGPETLAYASARLAGGTYQRAVASTQAPGRAAVEAVEDAATVLRETTEAMQDGRIDDAERERLAAAWTAIRDLAARQIGGLRVVA